MIEQSAIVVSTEAGIAEVEVMRRSTCGACSSQAACGVSLLDRVLGRRPQRLIVGNRLGVRAGDGVVVGVPETALLKAAVAAYLMPLVGLLGGAMLAQSAAASLWPAAGADASALLGGALGFAGALALLRSYSHRLAADPRYRATLLRRELPAAPVEVGLPGPR